MDTMLARLPGYTAAGKLRRWLIRTGAISPNPQILNIFTTDRCNFSCFYCSRNVADDVPGVENRYEDKSEFHIDDLRLLLAKYPGVREVLFVGIGEPFGIRDLIPMAEFAKAHDKRTSVITNGSLLHKHWGQVGRVFDGISISLHGLNAAELKAIAKVKEQVFNQFVANVQYLVKKERLLNPSMEVRASVVLLKGNMGRVRLAARFCHENGLPELDLQNYLPYGLTDSDNCIFDDDAEHIAFIDQLAREYDGRLKINPPALIKRHQETIKWGCMTFFKTLRVDGLGQVSGCSRIMVPLAANGDFRAEPDVWRNTYFETMRNRFRTRTALPECCRYCPEAQ